MDSGTCSTVRLLASTTLALPPILPSEHSHMQQSTDMAAERAGGASWLRR